MSNEVGLGQKEESRDTPILIKTYGEFWNPELVNWDNSWRLLGKRRADFKGPDVNVYEERGVYVLYKDYQPVYVGKADKQSVGYRLQLHRQSWRKAPVGTGSPGLAFAVSASTTSCGIETARFTRRPQS